MRTDTHLLPDILRARIFAIACGYEDADDLCWMISDIPCLPRHAWRCAGLAFQTPRC
jgi:hypothetical protein